MFDFLCAKTSKATFSHCSWNLIRESPVGLALLGKREGDEVQVKVPKGSLRFTITKIS